MAEASAPNSSRVCTILGSVLAARCSAVSRATSVVRACTSAPRVRSKRTTCSLPTHSEASCRAEYPRRSLASTSAPAANRSSIHSTEPAFAASWMGLLLFDLVCACRGWNSTSCRSAWTFPREAAWCAALFPSTCVCAPVSVRAGLPLHDKRGGKVSHCSWFHLETPLPHLDR